MKATTTPATRRGGGGGGRQLLRRLSLLRGFFFFFFFFATVFVVDVPPAEGCPGAGHDHHHHRHLHVRRTASAANAAAAASAGCNGEEGALGEESRRQLLDFTTAANAGDEGLQLCGMPVPTEEDKILLGAAAAFWDRQVGGSGVDAEAESIVTRYLERRRDERRRQSRRQSRELQSSNNKKQSRKERRKKRKEQKKENLRKKLEMQRKRNQAIKNKNNRVNNGGGGGQSSSSSPTDTLKVPVWFHIFQKSETEGGMTDEELQNGYIMSLKNAFADTPIQLVFKGVTRIVNENWFLCKNELEYKTSNKIGGPETLNIFVCDMAGQKKLGGNAHLPPIVETSPGYDGVTIMNPTLDGPGGDQFANQALVHETGHWFGLLHTFNDGCSARESENYEDFESYYVVGDGVRDTPAHEKATWEYPQNSYCWEFDELDTCPNDKPGVDPGPDPIFNYMNYLPGNCFEEFGTFTKGQMKRMVAEYLYFRKGAR